MGPFRVQAVGSTDATSFGGGKAITGACPTGPSAAVMPTVRGPRMHTKPTTQQPNTPLKHNSHNTPLKHTLPVRRHPTMPHVAPICLRCVVSCVSVLCVWVWVHLPVCESALCACRVCCMGGRVWPQQQPSQGCGPPGQRHGGPPVADAAERGPPRGVQEVQQEGQHCVRAAGRSGKRRQPWGGELCCPGTSNASSTHKRFELFVF